MALFTPSTYGNITISASNTTSTSGSVILSGGTASAYSVGTWSNGTNTPTLNVTGNADITGGLTVQGVDVVDLLEKIQERLAILVPDPKLLNKYQALREAYDNYKLLEALCIDESNNNK